MTSLFYNRSPSFSTSEVEVGKLLVHQIKEGCCFDPLPCASQSPSPGFWENLHDVASFFSPGYRSSPRSLCWTCTSMSIPVNKTIQEPKLQRQTMEENIKGCASCLGSQCFRVGANIFFQYKATKENPYLFKISTFWRTKLPGVWDVLLPSSELPPFPLATATQDEAHVDGNHLVTFCLPGGKAGDPDSRENADHENQCHVGSQGM